MQDNSEYEKEVLTWQLLESLAGDFVINCVDICGKEQQQTSLDNVKEASQTTLDNVAVEFLEEQISVLGTKIRQQSDDLLIKSNDLSEKEKEISVLKTEILQQTDGLSIKSNDLSEKEKEYSDLLSRYADLESNLDKLSCDSKASEERFNSELKEREDDALKLSSELKEWKLQLDEKSHECQQYEARIRDCFNRIVMTSVVNPSCAEMEGALDALIDSMTKNIDNDTVIANLKQVIEQRNQQISKAKESHQSEISNLLASLQEKDTLHLESCQTLEKMHSEVKLQLSHEIQLKAKQVREVEAASLELEENLNMIEEDKARLMEELASIRKESTERLANLQTKLVASEEDNDELKKAVDEMHKKMDRFKDDQVEDHKRELAELLESIRLLESELTDVKSEKISVEEELLLKREEVTGFEMKLFNLTTLKDKKDKEVYGLREELLVVQDTVEKQELEISEKEQRIREQELEISEKEQSIREEVKEEISEKEQRIREEVEKEISEKEQRVREEVEKAASVSAEFAEQSVRMQELSQKCHLLDGQLQQKTSE